MKEKTTPRTLKTADNDIQKRSMDAVPRWALAVCAVMLVMSFAIRQIGLDITTPINRIMSAHAVRIEEDSRRADGSNTEDLKEIKEEMKELKERVITLERWSHDPVKKKVSK